MESKESQPHPERSKRGGYNLRSGANPHRAAPGNTVTKNCQILAAFVPEKYESVHSGEPPGAADHRCASESQRWERASARSKSSGSRSEEHTSELQSPCNLVCRLLLEKKNCA